MEGLMLSDRRQFLKWSSALPLFAWIAGTDPAKIWQLPDTTGLKHEVIMFGGRSAFDSAIRLVGAKLVVVRTHDELQSAINSHTAMIYTTALGQKLEKAVAIAKKAGV